MEKKKNLPAPAFDFILGREHLRLKRFDGFLFFFLCLFPGKLLGMNETSATVAMATADPSRQAVSKQVLSVANVGAVSSSQNNVHR